MSWTSHVANSEGLAAIYGDAVPSLERVRLHEVSLDYERGLLLLRLDLAGFPENPPRKWAGSNVVQLDIQAAGVRSIDFRGSLTGEPVICRMRLNGGNSLEISLESKHLTLHCQAETAILARISAYPDEVPFELV